jgi:hypothetical protein
MGRIGPRSTMSPATAGCLHRQIVTEDDATKTQLAAQYLLQPERRKTGRTRIDILEDDMRRHHAAQSVGEQAERLPCLGPHRLEAALIDGNRHVGIRRHGAVAGKVLAHRTHAGSAQAGDDGAGEFGGNAAGSRCRARSPITELTP